MRAKNQAFAIFLTPLISHYPLPLNTQIEALQAAGPRPAHRSFADTPGEINQILYRGNPMKNPSLGVCPGGYFLLPNREQLSPRSLISIKRSAVQRGERISKKNGEMSYKFGEIIKKLYSLFQEAKPSRHSRLPPPPPPRKLRRRIFHVVERNVPVAGAVFTRQIYSRDGGGRAG